MRVGSARSGNKTRAHQNQAALADAARKTRSLRIEQLTSEINEDETALQTDLDTETRSTVKADRDAKLAERAQLNAEGAADFTGVLTVGEVEILTTMLADARKEVADKKKAAAAIAFAMKLADIALSVAAKAAAL